MTIKQQIVEEISKAIVKLDIPDFIPSVEYPSDPKHGDYSSNVAMIAYGNLARAIDSHVPGGKKPGVIYAKSKDKMWNDPTELANDISKELDVRNKDLKLFEKVEVIKPGFINLWISEDFLIQKLQNRSEISKTGKVKKVVVEYSSPNIAKPFTIGHLRSTIIGDAVANILEATGWEVFRDSHVGDWGTQFGKQIYAIKKWGDEAEIEKSERPVKMLVALYVRFHQEAEKNTELEEKAREWFKKLEAGDTQARELWHKCIEWSWKEFDAIYKELEVPSREGAEFENNGRGYGESFFEEKMERIVKELKDKGLLKKGKEGAQIVEFEEKSKLPPLMIIKKDGATLYATRDLATDKFRLEKYGSDVLVVNEVGAEQSLYFQQLYKLEEMLGWYEKDQRVHLKHGLIRFKEGKMSTRKGNTIWLEDVLEEAEKRATRVTAVSGERRGGWIDPNDIGDILQKDIDFSHGSRDEDINNVAIGAIKWNDLKRDPKQDIMFDWNDVLNMQGNSGPYIQYVYARTQSVLAKRATENLELKTKNDLKFEIGNSKLEIEERELLRLLARFDEIIEEAAIRFAPNILCTYLFELAQTFNLFYQKCPIIKSEGSIREFRLLVTSKTGEIIKKGLNLLGIEAPSKM